MLASAPRFRRGAVVLNGPLFVGAQIHDWRGLEGKRGNKISGLTKNLLTPEGEAHRYPLRRNGQRSTRLALSAGSIGCRFPEPLAGFTGSSRKIEENEKSG
jgi:hypothetical protein